MDFFWESNRLIGKDEDGQILAEANFEESNESVSILRIYVDESLRGQGIAGKLMELVMRHFVEQQKEVVPICPYAIAWLAKNTMPSM